MKEPVFLSGSDFDGPVEGAKWKLETTKVFEHNGIDLVFRKVSETQAVYCGTKKEYDALNK